MNVQAVASLPSIVRLGFLASMLVVTIFSGWVSLAEDSNPATNSPRTIKGEVIIVTDEFYLVQDSTGRSTQLRLSKASMDGKMDGKKDTKIEGALKAGDKVEAVVEADGHAITIKKLP
jgi:hypothetical protein